jgi:hypothetical protein
MNYKTVAREVQGKNQIEKRARRLALDKPFPGGMLFIEDRSNQT